jgi:hypothetical protein
VAAYRAGTAARGGLNAPMDYLMLRKLLTERLGVKAHVEMTKMSRSHGPENH